MLTKAIDQPPVLHTINCMMNVQQANCSEFEERNLCLQNRHAIS